MQWQEIFDVATLVKGCITRRQSMPNSFYDTKKAILGLGLGYEKIHACPNDCILNWRDLANVEVAQNVVFQDGRTLRMKQQEKRYL